MKRKLIAVISIAFCSMILMGAAVKIEPVYTVQKGDTLGRIAARYMPYTAAYTKKELINSIKFVNKIDGPLSLGQTLIIPVAWKEPLKPRTVSKSRDYVAKGLYMNTSSSGTRFIFESASKLRKLDGNTIVFDAKDDMGAITYPSPLPAKYCPNEHYTPNIEELPKLVDYLHRQGVHVVARVVVFRDPIMSKARPDWCSKREKQWLDPANPEVQEYVLAVIKELTNNGVDEIQLDYVRYFADRKTGTGKEGVSRTDVIAGFLKRVHEITQPRGVLLSVDMFGIVIWQRDVDVLTVGQDVSKIKKHVEIISPMLYPSHFNAGFGGVKNPADDPYRFVYNGVKRMKDMVGDEVIIRPWLQSFPLGVTKGFDAKYIQTQIEAAREAGGTGWLLWSPGNRYDKAYAAMHNLKKAESETREARSETKAKEPPRQPPVTKKSLEADVPAGPSGMPPTKETSGVNGTPESMQTEGHSGVRS